MSTETEIRVARVNAAMQQIPTAALVTVVNASLMTAVLAYAEPNRGIYAWLIAAMAIAAARLVLWWRYRCAAPSLETYWRWSLAVACSALAAGLLWGVGSVLLLPVAEVYRLFWVFLIGGMCAGAAALHFAHWPCTVAFIIPAGLPLAIRFALEDSRPGVAAALMILVFLVALVTTSWRASRNFGEMQRLRLDLAQRTRDLDVMNEQLQTEIAEHRATEANLLHAQKMEAVGQLTGAIAHDFNNLLTAVLVNLTLVRKHLPQHDQEARRLLDTAVQGAERGAALTQRLLAFGRRQALMPEVIDLPTVVHSMSALLASSLGPSVRVALRFPEVVPFVKVDASQLELALLNLVVNARDAMPAGGEVTISARGEQAHRRDLTGISPGHYVVLSVTDTGEGMDEATLARATEPFFTTKGAGKGTGLGLSMVHGFAVQSGGQFVLHSRKGQGTVAELWLPTAEAPPVSIASRPEAPRSQPASVRSGRVLVVDDDELVLASTSAVLRDLGYATIEAKSGRDALELQRRGEQVDLVITDYAMPGMNGLQLAEELHRTSPRLAIIIATGFSEIGGGSAITGTPVEGVVQLAKPFKQEALTAAIDRCCRVASSQSV